MARVLTVEDFLPEVPAPPAPLAAEAAPPDTDVPAPPTHYAAIAVTRSSHYDINPASEPHYKEFVLASLANRHDIDKEVQNYPLRGLTFAKLSNAQKVKLHDAYRGIPPETKMNIVNVFKDPNSVEHRVIKSLDAIQRLHRTTSLSAIFHAISFIMGVIGSALSVAMAFAPSTGLNQASAIFQLIFTVIGVANFLSGDGIALVKLYAGIFRRNANTLYARIFRRNPNAAVHGNP